MGTSIEWEYEGYGDYRYCKNYPHTSPEDAVKLFLDEYRGVREFAVWSATGYERLPSDDGAA